MGYKPSNSVLLMYRCYGPSGVKKQEKAVACSKNINVHENKDCVDLYKEETCTHACIHRCLPSYLQTTYIYYIHYTQAFVFLWVHAIATAFKLYHMT